MKITRSTNEYKSAECLSGLGRFLIDAHSTLYRFCYALTFKKELKSLESEFRHPDEHPINQPDLFKNLDDPLVRHAYYTMVLIINYVYPYLLRNGFQDIELIEDDEVSEQAKRYAPIYITIGRKKSYIQTSLLYKHYIEQLAVSFYYYACALSLESYRIPRQLRLQIDYSRKGHFRWLNVDNYEVASLVELIEALKEKEQELEGLMNKKK